MLVTVACLARYAEIFGAPVVTVELGEGSMVSDLIYALRQLPGGEFLPLTVIVAVNHRIATPDQPLPTGAEVAVLPPFAGG